MSRFLALDADSRGAFLISGSTSRTGTTIDHVLALPDDESAISAPAEFGARLKGILKEAGINPAPLLVAVSRDRVIIKDVTYPRVPLHEEPNLVRFQAQRDLTESPDNLVMDYVPADGKDGSRLASVVFIRKEVLLGIRQLADAAGLKLQSVVPRPYASVAAARRAMTTGGFAPPDDPTLAVGVLSLWDRGGEFSVFRGNQLLLTRSVSPASLMSETALIGEMKRNLATFANQHNGIGIHTLCVAEGFTSGPSWVGRLQSTLPIPVVALDPLAGVPVASRVPPALHGRFLSPVGLVASRMPNESTTANFLAPRQPRPETNKGRTRILVGALLLILAVAGVLVFGMLEVSKAKTQLARANQDKESLTKKNEKLAVELKKLVAIEDFATREVPWLDVYYDVSAQFPDIKKGRVMSFEGTLEKPPVETPQRTTTPAPRPTGTPASGASAAPNTLAVKAPAKVPALDNKPVSKLKIVVSSEDTELAEKFKDTFKAPYYEKTTKDTSKKEGGSSSENAKLFTIETFLMRRKPTQFTEKIIAAPPPAPKPLDPEDPDGPPEPAPMKPSTPTTPPAQDPFFDPLNPGFNNGGFNP